MRVASGVEKYYIVIVGGGTAGCVLAARLTEDGRRTVLLVEADPDFQGFDQLPDDRLYRLLQQWVWVQMHRLFRLSPSSSDPPQRS